MRPYLRAANVGWPGLLLNDVKTMNFSDPEMDVYGLRPGDLLLSEASGSPGEVGKPALWSGEIDDCAFQNTLIRVRPQGPEPEYLLHYFRYVALTGGFTQHSRGVGIHHLGRARLAGWLTPLPPIAEQRRIVDILEDHLSRRNAAMASLAKADTRVRALERSALDHHFGSNSGGGVPLDELVADISAGKSFGSSNAPAGPEEWGIIKVSAMTWGEFRPEENKAVSAERVDLRFEIRPGDLLVSRANTSEYVGASVLVRSVRPKLLLSDKSLRVTPRQGVRVEWLWRALQAPSARRQISALATGTKDSMRNISQASLRRILLPKADLDEQVKAMAGFIQIKSAIDRMRTELAFQERRSAALRRSLLAAAFSGQLTGRSSDTDLVEEMADA